MLPQVVAAGPQPEPARSPARWNTRVSAVSCLLCTPRHAGRRLRSRWRPFAGLFDAVVTTNSGCPLDQHTYQAIKSKSAAATVVKNGRALVSAA